MKQLWPREEELKKVLRYGTQGEWSPMYYRPDLLIHTSRVQWISQEICKYLQNLKPDLCDYEKATEFAKFHDDSEILAWDILSLNKERFSQEEKEEYDKKTLTAIETLTQEYSWETDFDYKELLLIDFHKTGIEYLIGMYADKLDAHMEVCHELFAGSTTFYHILKKWNLPYTSFEYTKLKALWYLEKLEQISWVHLKNNHPFFSFPDIDIESFVKNGKPHSEESLKKDIWYIPYDTWKKLHFLSWNSRQKEYLWTRREFT